MNTEKSKILIVDDEPDVVDILKDFLSMKGYDTLSAFNGEEALDVLEKEKANLVLLDLMMPGLKGTEVAKIIKQKYPYIKIILLTGFPNETAKLSKDDILEDVLLKPIKMQELLNHLVKTLSKEENQTVYKKQDQPIMARVLFIKAKLLIVEQNSECYNFLKEQLHALFTKGENYEIELAATEEQLYEKSILFKPDIYLVNASFMKENSKDILSCMSESNSANAELIVYNHEEIITPAKVELTRIKEAVKTTCLRYGFIDIKWVEI